MWNTGNVIEQLLRQIKGKLVNHSEDLLLRLDQRTNVAGIRVDQG